MSIMNQPHGTRLIIGSNDGSEAQKLSNQSSGSERSTHNDQSFVKTAISLFCVETRSERQHIGAFSGRRLLFEGQFIPVTSQDRGGET